MQLGHTMYGTAHHVFQVNELLLRYCDDSWEGALFYDRSYRISRILFVTHNFSPIKHTLSFFWTLVNIFWVIIFFAACCIRHFQWNCQPWFNFSQCELLLHNSLHSFRPFFSWNKLLSDPKVQFKIITQLLIYFWRQEATGRLRRGNKTKSMCYLEKVR